MSNTFAVAAVVVVLLLVVLVWAWPKRPDSDSAWTVAGVRFDTTGWQLQEASPTTMTWTNPDGDVLTLRRLEGEAVPSAEDLPSLRMRARQLASMNRGGIVHADFVDRGGVRAASLIFKHERLPAYSYTGMFIIPRGDHHLVVTVESVERGTTGMRDAMVTMQLLQQGTLDPMKKDANGRVEGWFRDPYEPAYNASALHSVADDERYDSILPSHPLSKVRETLRMVQNSFEL